VTSALAFIALIGLMVFAFYAMWGMPGRFRGHHEDGGPAVGGGADGGDGSWGHHDGDHGGHGDSGGHGGGSH